MNEANQLILSPQERAEAAASAQSGYHAGRGLEQNTMNPTPGDYDTSTTVAHASLGSDSANYISSQQWAAGQAQHAEMVAKHEAERAAEKFGRVRAAALEAALRCIHPGSMPSEVIRAARDFEAYLTGADTTATLP